MYSLGVGRGMVLMVVGAVGDLCGWGACLGIVNGVLLSGCDVSWWCVVRVVV